MSQELLSKTKTELTTVITELENFYIKNSFSDNVLNEIKQKLDNREINLTVLGEFNRGKSTFINSLIGDDILPTGITPTTSSINILKYSADPYLKVLYQDQTSENKILESEAFTKLTYENISHLEIGHNSEFLKNLVMVDTPGVNDINSQRIEVTYNFIPKSDAVIFLLDAEQVLSKSEFDFFQNKVLSADINKIIFVINKIDNLNKEDLQEIETYAHQKISSYINDPLIISYSSKRALYGKTNNDQDELNNSNYPQLQETIKTNILEKQDSILINSVVNNLSSLISSLSNKLKLEKTLFGKSIEELENNIQVIKEKEETLSQNLEELLKAFRKQVEQIKANEIAKIKSFSLELSKALDEDFEELSYQDVKTFLPLFIQDKFKEQIELQEVTIKTSILEIYQSSVDKIGKLFEDIKEEIDLKIDFSLVKVGNINKTSGLDISSSALMTSGIFVMFLGGLFPLIAGLLMIASGGFLSFSSKDSMQKDLKVELKKIANNSISTAAEKISPKISDIVDEISEKIQLNLRELFKEEFNSIHNSINSVIDSKKLMEVETSVKIAELDDNLNFLADKNNQVLNTIL